jgi:hypothetical protein
MNETRAARYGRNLAIWVEFTINKVPERERAAYKKKFLNELDHYSFEPRKNGQPRNSGCIHELSDISIADVSNPKDLAKIVKEGFHLLYQKGTSARVYNALVDYLNQNT